MLLYGTLRSPIRRTSVRAGGCVCERKGSMRVAALVCYMGSVALPVNRDSNQIRRSTPTQPTLCAVCKKLFN